MGYNTTYPKAPFVEPRIARKGLVLRCDENMVVSGNVLTDVEYGVYQLYIGPGLFNTTLNGLQITGNRVVEHEGDHIFTVEGNLSTVTGFGLANNIYQPSNCGYYFSKINGVQQAKLANWIAALPANVNPKETGSTTTCP